MIGCTKLLCGTATVSEAMRLGRDTGELPPHLLQFSSGARPIVFWNMTNRCNLNCKHCYISAEDRHYPNELTTPEAEAFIDDLASLQVPVLLFTGGEPLLRKDIFALGRRAFDKGLRPVISSNGTLITPERARQIKDAGFQYVGISLDGAPETHNEFRGRSTAFEQTLRGIRNCLEAGIKAGVRFTINKYNQDDLPEILDIVEKEGIPRFCMYHLVYAGRGREMADMDQTKEEKRRTMEYLVEKTLELHHKGVEVEILTTDNHADGIYLLNYIKETQPERAGEVMELLRMHGGCSAGVKAANVDPQGNVHPCQFWSHVTLGNVRERKFSEIWTSNQHELLAKLRAKGDHVEGKCGRCRYVDVCGGCRIRAEMVYGHPWAEDPTCYLTEEEIA